MTDDEPRLAKPRRTLTLSGLVSAAGAVGASATILGFLGRYSWFLDLFSHFRVQYLAGLCVVALVLSLIGSKKSAGAFAFFAIVNGATLLPYVWPWQTCPQSNRQLTAGNENEPTIRLLLLNVNTRQGNADRVAELLTVTQADIIVLEEISQDWVAALKPVLADWPYQLVEPRNDNFGIGVFSRFPMTASRTDYLGDSEVPTLIAKIAGGGSPFTLIATHALPPMNAEYARLRNQQLELLPTLVEQADTPVLLVGDLNCTPWSDHFQQLVRRADLQDSLRGRGLQPTWPAEMWLLRIPLDHCLYGEGIEILERRVGPDAGSDHLPVIVDFQIADRFRNSAE